MAYLSNEPHLTDEQLIALHESYKQDTIERDEQLKRKHPELFVECKSVARMFKNEMFTQIKLRGMSE